MKFYCGIDLGARTLHLCVVDEKIHVLVDEKLPCALALLIEALEPYRDGLRIVVESTFNWYWIVDGLQEKGFDVCLAHTLGLSMITKAKVKTDRRDAFALAKLLRIDAIPEAYIYPKHTRPLRDLLRRRGRLVNARGHEYGSLRSLLVRYGILAHSRNSIKNDEHDEILRWLEHPLVKLHATQQLERIELYSRQIVNLEGEILAHARSCDDYQRIRSVPGFGVILALSILYEIGEISRFDNPRRFSSYCRLVPGIAQSGSTIRRGRGSKQGNHHLKWAFSQAALHAVRYYPKIRRCYDRHLNRHKGRARKLIAYNVIAHKLALAVYHVLKNKTSYKEEMLFGS